MARKYGHITPEVERQMRDLASKGTSHRAIAEQFGVSQTAVSNRLRKAPVQLSIPDGPSIALSEPERLATGEPETAEALSVKQRLLRAIAEEGPVEDLSTLIKLIRTPQDTFDAHDANHLLFSLNSGGLVKYREDRRAAGPGNTHPKRIECTPAGFAAAGFEHPGRQVGQLRFSRVGEEPQRKSDRTDFRTHGTHAVGGPIERSKLVVSPEVRADVAEVIASAARTNEEQSPAFEWPELQRLREMDAERKRTEALVDSLVEAAAILARTDPEESERLMDRADGIARSVMLTPGELEYIAFAAALEK